MRAALLLVVILAGPKPGFAEPYWNQFRGPDGNGHTLVKGLPTTFDESKNVKWKTPIKGKAWSSPTKILERYLFVHELAIRSCFRLSEHDSEVDQKMLVSRGYSHFGWFDGTQNCENFSGCSVLRNGMGW